MAPDSKKSTPSESPGIKIVSGFAELKPSEPGKRPHQVCSGAKTYRGDRLIIVGKKAGKPIVEVVKSKVKYVPEAVALQVEEKFHKLFMK